MTIHSGWPKSRRLDSRPVYCAVSPGAVWKNSWARDSSASVRSTRAWMYVKFPPSEKYSSDLGSEEAEVLARLELDPPELRLFGLLKKVRQSAPPSSVDRVAHDDALDRILDRLVEGAEGGEIAELAPGVLRPRVPALDLGELELRIADDQVVGAELDGGVEAHLPEGRPRHGPRPGRAQAQPLERAVGEPGSREELQLVDACR